jgi:hypothetical protein
MPEGDDFTVPPFRREEMEGQREEAAARSRRGNGPHLRSLAFRVSELLVRGNTADYELGALIDEIAMNEHWRGWPGQSFERFTDWTWIVLGFRGRKAEYLRANWKALSAMHLSEVALSSALRIGWTKLGQILRIARDEVTLFQWIDKCNENNWNEKELRAAIIEAGAVTRAPNVRDPSDADDADTADAPRDPENRPRQFTVVFEDAESFRTVRRGIEVIAARYSAEIGDGKALALMATSYLASVPRNDEGGAAVELEYLIRQVEQNYGVKLMVAPDAGEAEEADEAEEPPASSHGSAVMDI